MAAKSTILLLLFSIFFISTASARRGLLQTSSFPTPLDPATFPTPTDQPADQPPIPVDQPAAPVDASTAADQPAIPDTQPLAPDTSLPPPTDTPASVPAPDILPSPTDATPAPADAPASIPADTPPSIPADAPAATTTPVTTTTPATRTAPLPTAAATTTTAPPDHTPVISFYMHDVLGGTHASGRVVTGIIASSDSSAIPFSKPNNDIFPLSNGVPLSGNQINNIINNNNAPFISSLNGQQQSQRTIQNAGTGNNVNSNTNTNAFVSAGQLPAGATLEKLMFGSITVIDDQLTEGHELGAGIVGNAQGIYLASSLDGQSHTMAYTALFGEGVDGISFFGVHRVAAPVSTVAVIGGTGKYDSARGYATIETVPMTDQLTTDGVDTIVKVTVFLI